MLVSIVDIIQQSIRPDDILARLEDGRCLACYLPNSIVPRRIIAERMRKNIEGLPDRFSNGSDYVPEQMTISIGTVFSTGDTRNIFACHDGSR
ncbi:diguanylate cyclase domain-containing protein [Escherichia coli]